MQVDIYSEINVNANKYYNQLNVVHIQIVFGK